eukprot:scaffold17507_cov37-Cyclotella_meneghiniana.AAC.8
MVLSFRSILRSGSAAVLPTSADLALVDSVEMLDVSGVRCEVLSTYPRIIYILKVTLSTYVTHHPVCTGKEDRSTALVKRILP